MLEKENCQEEELRSRSEKVLEAKRAFSDDRYDIEDDSSRHSFWLLRFMTAGMLFFILLVAIYNGFSYYGFNREYIENCLSDEKYYDMFLKCVCKTVTEIMTVINNSPAFHHMIIK